MRSSILRSFSTSIRTPTPREEIGRLTQAQRRAVLSGTIRQGPGYWPLHNALIDKGLFASANRIPVLTAWGKRIQQLLKDEGAA